MQLLVQHVAIMSTCCYRAT